jgi:hypothetical protein
MFGETHSDVIKFVNHYLPGEVEDAISVTVVSKIMKRVPPNQPAIWSVEVACDDKMDRGEEKRTELRDKLVALIRLYGENCGDVIMKRVYINKERYLSL